jgi:hypothetical protein
MFFLRILCDSADGNWLWLAPTAGDATDHVTRRALSGRDRDADPAYDRLRWRFL